MIGTLYDRFRFAEEIFAERDYARAAQLLEAFLTDAAADPECRHGMGDARLLLARAYYHSAQLGRAEQALRAMIDDDPTDAYAVLLLGRTLQRAGQHDEARGLLARAEAMGLAG